MALKSNFKGQKGGEPPRKSASSSPLKKCKVGRSPIHTHNNLNKPPNKVDTHANLVPKVLIHIISKGDKIPEEASFIHPTKNRFSDTTTSANFAEKNQAVGFFPPRDNNYIEENVVLVNNTDKSSTFKRLQQVALL